MNSFDAKINTENLTKCLQTLKQFYGDLYKDKVNNETQLYLRVNCILCWGNSQINLSHVINCNLVFDEKGKLGLE